MLKKKHKFSVRSEKFSSPKNNSHDQLIIQQKVLWLGKNGLSQSQLHNCRSFSIIFGGTMLQGSETLPREWIKCNFSVGHMTVFLSWTHLIVDQHTIRVRIFTIKNYNLVKICHLNGKQNRLVGWLFKMWDDHLIEIFSLAITERKNHCSLTFWYRSPCKPRENILINFFRWHNIFH